MYITIVGLERYLGTESYKVGQELTLKKDADNKYDDEAIKVETETGVTCGYVANSVSTVARGTHSAGYVRSAFENTKQCKVVFIVENKLIAEIV